MRVPRVFLKAHFFWIAWHEPGEKNAVKRSTHIRCDVPYTIGKPNWWHKSKYRKQIEQIIERIEAHRLEKKLNLEWGLPINTISEPEPIYTFEEILKTYITYAGKKRNRALSKDRILNYRGAIRVFAQFNNELPYDITEDTVHNFVEWATEEEYAPNSIKVYVTALAALYNFAAKRKMIPSDRINPFKEVTVNVVTEEKRLITFEEEKSVLRWLYENSQLEFYAYLFLRLNGFRKKDMRLFAPSQIRPDEISYINHKANKRIEKFPISEPMKIVIEMMKKDYPERFKTEKIFIGHRDKFGDALKAACAHNKIAPYYPHLLKSLYARDINKHAKSSMTFDALLHHAPTKSFLAITHYSGNDFGQMEETLNASLAHWVEFLKGLQRGQK